MYATAEERDDRPQPGDRVKLFGDHRWAGYTAVYLADRQSPWGMRPVVKIDNDGAESFVLKPDDQMRKI